MRSLADIDTFVEHIGLVVKALDSGAIGTGFESRIGAVCCVLGQDTLSTLLQSTQL